MYLIEIVVGSVYKFDNHRCKLALRAPKRKVNFVLFMSLLAVIEPDAC